MKNTLYIWLTIIFLALLTLPGLYNRHTVETGQNHYEVVMPLPEILKLSDQLNQPIESLLINLKSSGLSSVAVSPETLSSLEERGDISIYSKSDLQELLLFQPGLSSQLEKEEGSDTHYYFTIPEDVHMQELLEQRLNPMKITLGDTSMYRVIDTNEPFKIAGQEFTVSVLNRFLGYNEHHLELISANHLDYILRIENSYPDQANILADVLRLKSEHSNGLLFSGEELLGYPSQPLMTDYSKQLADAGFYFYSIEFSNQRGLTTYGESTDYHFVRLHSLVLESNQLDTSIQRSIRAIKERNIRSLFVRLPQKLDPEAQIELAEDFLTSLEMKMPRKFTQGTVTPFELIKPHQLATIASIIGSVLLTFVALSILPISWVKYASSGVLLLIGGGLIILERTLFNQAFALIIALIGATYATLIAADGNSHLKGLLRTYLKSLGITVLTIVFLTQILNGNGYINGFIPFRGVNLVYTLPIIIISLWASKDLIMYIHQKIKGKKQQLLREYSHRFMQLSIKYWHLIIIAAVAFSFYYYLSRGGNAGTVSEIELWFRNQLERVLYVRPRTKEFLIGLPVFVLSVYLTGRHPKIGRYFFIVGSIGFLSIINTFSHLHTPLYISLIRSVYSLILGFLIGLLLIKIVNWLERKVKKIWR